MKIINKLKTLMKAIRKVNKKGILKKVYFEIKVGGVNALKQAIIKAACRNENIENITFSSQEFNIYQEQQLLEEYDKYYENKKVTIIVFVSNNDYFIKDTLDSLKNQSHNNIEIILLLPSYLEQNNNYKVDKSVNFDFYDNNFSLYDYIKTIEGEYFILLNAGNTLAPNALKYYTNELKKGYAFVYSDECIWNFDSSTIEKHFLKPDLSVYYLYNNLYTEQGVCFNKNEMLNLGHFNCNSVNVANLINQCVLKMISRGKKASHIEKILLLRHYHYELMTKFNYTYTYEMIQEALNYLGIQTYLNKQILSNDFDNNYCEILKLDDIKISIIIPCYDANLARNLINSIISNTLYKNYEIIIVANRNTNLDIKESINNIKFLELNNNFNYSKANNMGFKLSTGEISVFMQENMYVKDNNWLSEIVRCFSFPYVGGVSPKILRNDNTIRYSGAIAGGFDFTPLPFNGEINEKIEDFTELTFISREVSILSASCLAIRNSLFRKLDGFNEVDTPNKFSNADLSFGIEEEGYRCIYCATSNVHSNSAEWYDNWFDKSSDTAYIYLLKKWPHKLTHDPFFTDSMKKHIINKLPIDYKISINKDKVNKNKRNNKQRNILLVSHELSITGAPVALHYAAKALLENGDYPVIISPFDGNLRQTIVDDGIPVIVDYSIIGDKIWINFAKNFDLVVVSTLVCNNMIKFLEEANIPTIWWAHEAKASYEIGALKKTLPDSIMENIHLFCGGEYARKVLKSYRPNYEADILLYAVPDYSNSTNSLNYHIPNIDNKIVFSTIGSIMDRKGQDILAKSIMELPIDVIKNCRFIFIGKKVDASTYSKVLELKDKYSDEVILIEEVSRYDLMEMYKLCDCVICASRDDPMPVFMTEAMMFSKICICSENTGTAALINDGENGFIYSNNDYNQLMQKMLYVVEHINDLDDMKNKSRKTYEDFFTMESFSKRFISIIDSITNK